MSNITSSGRQTITAFFDSRAEADRAVERIRAEGVSSADVRIIDGNDTAASGYDRTAPAAESKGFWASLGDLFIPDEDRYTYAEGLSRGGYLVTVTTADTNHERILDILDDEGTVDMDARESSWRSEGWSGYQSGADGYSDTTSTRVADASLGDGNIGAAGYSSATVASSSTAETTDYAAGGSTAGYAARSDRTLDAGRALDADKDGTIEVMEERLRVGKRDVSHGRVRVRSYVVEEPIHEEIGLRSERVEIERRPVDRAVSSADLAFQDRTLELEETAEEAVVSKEARVKEEINLNRKAEERTETISDSVRRTEVEIEDERTAGTVERTGTAGTAGTSSTFTTTKTVR